jgi:hypothetical protein
LDQPRVQIQLRRLTKDQPLSAKIAGEEVSDIEAFLDTGASGVLLSQHTADALGVRAAPNVTFEDVGVAGSDRFGVSEPVLASFDPPCGALAPLRCQIGPEGNLLNALLSDLDIAGMPMMAGKVIVIDPKPLNKFDDRLRVRIHQPGEKEIPQTTQHVKLTFVSFKRFTRTTPAAASGPTVGDNPLIGPNPFIAGDNTPAIGLGFKGKSSRGSFLLDTGSACSMISKKQAEKLGVRYSPDSETHLENIPDKDQFTLTVGGIGGQHRAAGFYLDTLTVPTREGKPLVYRRVPVLVSDITLLDPATKQPFTLDGVFGMNLLVASAHVTEGLLPDISNLTPSPFSLIVLDMKQGTLGVK